MARGGGGGSRGGGGSFGGSRGGGGRSGGSFGGSRGGSFGGGSFGGWSRSSGSSGGFRPTHTGGGGFRPVYTGGGNGCRGCGCGTPSLVVVVFIVIAAVIFGNVSGMFGSTENGGSGITQSTIEREPLPKGSVDETDYYTDELGWIENRTKLEQGLKYFYDKTGVQPYLYITDTVLGSHSPSMSDMERYANQLYDQIFTDEAHLLLLFFEHNSDSNYMDWYVTGTQAKSVVDSEAGDILLDYIDRYYYYDGLTDEEFFSKSFSDAADRIMKKAPVSAGTVAIIVLGAIIVIVILSVWWNKAKKQKNLEAKQTEEILSAPLEKFGDQEAQELAKKYDDNDKGDE